MFPSIEKWQLGGWPEIYLGLRTISLIALLLSTASAGGIPATQPSVVLSGTVVDSVTGLPVSGAEILLYENGPPFSEESVPTPLRSLMRGADITATSDGAGRFAIPAPEGNYGVGVSADGYVHHELGAPAPGLSGSLLTVGSEIDEPLEIRLIPEGRIAGSVFDDDGRPVTYVSVYLLRPIFQVDGTLRLAVEAQTRTNEAGRYQITRIPPGRYLVMTGGGTGNSDLVVDPSGNNDDTEYRWSFYPGVEEPELAGSIVVSPGSTRDLIDLFVAPERLRRVTGRIVKTTTNAPPRDAVVTFHSRVPFESTAVDFVTAEYDQDSGAFEVELAEGSYRIGVSLGEVTDRQERFAQRNRPRDAWIPLEVGTGDRDDLLVLVPTNGSLRGQFVLPNGEPFSGIGRAPGGPGPGVTLQPLDPLQQSAVIRPTAVDGSFDVPNLVFGSYRVTPNALPGDYYVGSVSLNGQRLDSMVLDIAPYSHNTLEIEVRPNGGRVDLTVVDPEGHPVPSATILLLPDPVPDRIGHYQWSASNGLGRSVLRQVPPGDYKVLAWLDVARSGFPVPESREGLGATVRVQENATVTLQVETENLGTLRR